jgi:peptidoglycan/LPS O-acetylase OafA/YrhL
MSINLEKAIRRENNNFDLIRLIASLAVIFGHSFYLFPTNSYQGSISIFLKNNYNGNLAVYVFFFLSGIFITSSFDKSNSPVKFVIARVFRIWPALIVCILVTVFVVGPIFTNRSLVDYFTAHQTWRYLIKNGLIFHFEAPLTGVFGDGVNGSLWTLHTEVLCYFIILVIGVLGLLKRKIYVIAVVIILYLIRHNQYFVYCFNQTANVLQLMFFLFGTLSYTFRKYFIIDYKIGLAIISIFLISCFLNFPGTQWLSYLALIYSMLLLATAGFFKRLRPPGDFSYGIYIYGFLIQQIIVCLFPKLTSFPSMLVTMPLACIVGGVSWYFIENKAIKKAKKLSISYEVRKVANA